MSLIFTSPPYLRVVRYGKFNWIRLWLLGESVEAIDRNLSVDEIGGIQVAGDAAAAEA